MQQPLTGKKVLLAEGDDHYCGLISQDLQQLGAEVLLANDSHQCFSIYYQTAVDLLLCDLALPPANAYQIVRRLRAEGSQLPIIILTNSEDHTNIATILRLGVQDIILKSIISLATLRSKLLAALFPDIYNCRVELNQSLLDEWAHLSARPQQAVTLLQQLQPPIRQHIAHCLVNYRHLRQRQGAGLVLDMEEISPQTLAFYIIDTSNIGKNGLIGSFMLRALFSNLIQKYAVTSTGGADHLLRVLQELNTALLQSGLIGALPVVMGYYFAGQDKLLLLPAGVSCTLTCGQQRYVLRRGSAPGILPYVDAQAEEFTVSGFECRFSGKTATLELMLSRDKKL